VSSPCKWNLCFSGYYVCTALYSALFFLQSKKGRASRVGAILDHVTQFRTEVDFAKLCDSLAVTDQQEIVSRYLTADATSVADYDSSRQVVSTGYRQPGSIVGAWRTILIQQRSSIVAVLQSSDQFVNALVNYGVMNFSAGERCRVRPPAVNLFNKKLKIH